MNTWGFKTLGNLPACLWRHYQKWRALRMYAQVVRLEQKAARLFDKANRLIAENVPPPLPLFEQEGR